MHPINSPASVLPDVASPALAIDRFLDSLRKPARVLVAISGGSDSTGLLVLLHNALKGGRFPSVELLAATVDHGLRPGSAREAAFVAEMCAELGIPHRTLRWDGDKPSTGISAAARAARHRLLADAAQALDADLIAVAHTFNDQQETIAMRATRGATTSDIGLSGMAEATLFDRRVWIVRPLLSCRRADIRDALTAAGLGWIDDPSNEDRRFERARTRQELAAGTLSPTTGMSDADRLALSSVAARVIERHATAFASTVAYLAATIAVEPPEAVRHALGALVMTLGGREHRPAGKSMDELVELAIGSATGRMTLGRCLASRRREGLYLVRERRGILPLLVAGGATAIWDGRYRIINKGREAALVETATPPEIMTQFATLPPDIARRAASVFPRIQHRSTSADVDCDIVVGGYDRYLPLFDLPLANALATLFGRQGYLPPPFRGC